MSKDSTQRPRPDSNRGPFDPKSDAVTDWPLRELLPFTQFSINSSRHCSTGHSPFFLNHGQEPLTFGSLVDARTRRGLEDRSTAEHSLTVYVRHEAISLAKDELTAVQARQAMYSDCGRKRLDLTVGEKVMVHREYLITPRQEIVRTRSYGRGGML